jgi:hypothetical protein
VTLERLTFLKQAVTEAQKQINRSHNFFDFAKDKSSFKDFQSSIERWTKAVMAYNRAETEFLEGL